MVIWRGHRYLCLHDNLTHARVFCDVMTIWHVCGCKHLSSKFRFAIERFIVVMKNAMITPPFTLPCPENASNSPLAICRGSTYDFVTIDSVQSPHIKSGVVVKIG